MDFSPILLQFDGTPSQWQDAATREAAKWRPSNRMCHYITSFNSQSCICCKIFQKHHGHFLLCILIDLRTKLALLLTILCWQMRTADAATVATGRGSDPPARLATRGLCFSNDVSRTPVQEHQHHFTRSRLLCSPRPVIAVSHNNHCRLKLFLSSTKTVTAGCIAKPANTHPTLQLYRCIRSYPFVPRDHSIERGRS